MDDIKQLKITISPTTALMRKKKIQRRWTKINRDSIHIEENIEKTDFFGT